MSIYSDDVVYFDIVPPLRYAGADALRGRFLDWFGRWRSPIGQELSDVTISESEGLAAAHMLVRASGTLLDGRDVAYWVRVSNVLRQSQQRWLITHEHVSVPVDFASGTVVLDLEP